MLSSSTRSSLFLLLMIFPSLPWVPKPSTDAAAATQNDSWGLCFKFTVHVMNGFSNNDQPLKLHCWSRDDDLGSHTLQKNADFHFNFGDDFLGNSLFTCEMKWGSKHKVVDVFAPTVEGNDCCDTETCYWRAQDDGIYFCNDNKSYTKRSEWD